MDIDILEKPDECVKSQVMGHGSSQDSYNIHSSASSIHSEELKAHSK